MKQITCIITDDEPLARAGLQRYVQQFPFLHLLDLCEDAQQLECSLRSQPADLLFLDIEMPRMSGITFIQGLSNPPKVIFTTAYEQYALQGFELDVLDYLLKPISPERFAKAAHKAFEYFSVRQPAAPAFCFIKVNGRLEKVFYDDIIFIEGLENYVIVHTKEGRMITHATLKSMKEEFPGFIQPHKSYLVHPAHITAVEGSWLFCARHKIPVSKYQRKEVREAIVKHRLGSGGTPHV